MDEKEPAVAGKPPLVIQPPKRKVFTTLLALLAALSVVAFFHQRPLETNSQRILEKEPLKEWTWNDVSGTIDAF
jgi:hypothetical protein